MNLYYLPTCNLYAESHEEYCLRREVYLHFGKELPREIAKNNDWDRIINFMEKSS